eukprot:1393865-Rhodomonas_salina.1
MGRGTLRRKALTARTRTMPWPLARRGLFQTSMICSRRVALTNDASWASTLAKQSSTMPMKRFIMIDSATIWNRIQKTTDAYDPGPQSPEGTQPSPQGGRSGWASGVQKGGSAMPSNIMVCQSSPKSTWNSVFIACG